MRSTECHFSCSVVKSLNAGYIFFVNDRAYVIGPIVSLSYVSLNSACSFSTFSV